MQVATRGYYDGKENFVSSLTHTSGYKKRDEKAGTHSDKQYVEKAELILEGASERLEAHPRCSSMNQ